MRNNNTGFTRHLSESGFVQVILILVIVFVVIGGAYYFGTLKNKPNLMTNTSTTPTNPATKWITYSNNLFSFEYPNIYTIRETEDSEMIILNGEDGNPEQIYFDWRKNEFSGITIEQKLKEIKKTDIVKSEKIIPYGVELIVTENGRLGGRFGVETGDVRVLLLDTNNDRLIKLTTNLPKEVPLGNFDQILSTFKFLSQDLFTPIPCAGFAGVKCPQGYTCKVIDTYPDAAGSCVK